MTTRERRVLAYCTQLVRTDGGYWHTQVDVWEAAARRMEPIEDCIRACESNPEQWKTPGAAARMAQRYRDLQAQGATHVFCTVFSDTVHTLLSFQHYNTQQSRQAGTCSQQAATDDPQGDQYCEAEVRLHVSPANTLAAAKLLAKLDRKLDPHGHYSKWNHPAPLLQLLFDCKARELKRLHTTVEGYDWWEWCAVQPVG